MQNNTLQFFSYSHLKAELKDTSKLFSDLAEILADALPENQEKSACFRKLLEAKDCAVRAHVYQPDAKDTPKTQEKQK